MGHERQVVFVGSSKKDLLALPEEVWKNISYALDLAQRGITPPNVKLWHGLGSGVVEVVEDHLGDAYRAVFTVRFANALYVLHVFQKKSKQGIATPKPATDLMARRLKDAEAHFKEHFEK